MQTHQTTISFKIRSFLKKHVADQYEPETLFRCERRATAIIPQLHDDKTEVNWEGREFARQLLFIENKQQTCCIKISSERFLSRSALLVFRGRLIGSIYGNKKHKEQIFGESARQRIFSDLCDLESEIRCYPLPEEYALSSSALFQGSVYSGARWMDAEVALTRAHYCLIKQRRPGFITISDHAKQGVTLCIYYFNGKILGTYSQFDGWQKPVFQTGERDLGFAEQPLIHAFKLDKSVDEFLATSTISLTGLADRRIEDWLPPEPELEEFLY